VYEVSEVTDIEANTTLNYTYINSTNWGHLEIKTYYNDNGAADDPNKINRIRVVYRGEVTGTATIVYQIDQETPVPNTTEFTSAKETNPYFVSETFTKYDKTPNNVAANNEEVRNTAVYNNKNEVVYRIDRTVFTPEPAVTYNSTVRSSWPAVLGSLEKRTWTKRDGTEIAQYVPKYKRESYDGAAEATVTETWSKEAPTQPTTIGPFLQPSPVIFVCPLFSVNIKACLHPAIALVGTTGTTTEWDYLTWNENFPATKEVDWVDRTITNEVSPFQGGFLQKKVIIKPPL